MRLVIDAREYTSSTGRYMFRLLEQLEKLDNQHDYTILLKPTDMEVYSFSNPRFTKVACPHKEFTFDEQTGFRKQLIGLKPDLVHFGMVQQPIRYKGTVVTTIHDLTTVRFHNPAKNPIVFKLKQRVYRYVIKRAARKSSIVITPSNYVKEDVVRFTGIPVEKVVVTYEAADLIPKHGEPVDALMHKEFIMYLGRPTPHKNLERLLDAFALLQAQHPTLYLALAGKKDANYQRIERLAQSKSLQNVIFTDFITDQQLRWMYEHCSVYAFPSLSEGFGLPGLEAMAHGAPVVSSNATCLPEIYGQAAHYFDPLDTQAMANAINDVLTNNSMRQQLIMAGRRQAAQYSWQRMAEQTLTVYRKVLGEA